VFLYLNHSLATLTLNLVVFLYLSKSLDYPTFILSFVNSLKLHIDFGLVSLAIGNQFRVLLFSFQDTLVSL